MRTNILPSELKVGDKVAIWGTSMFPNRGYTVAKVDKMKAVLVRGDNYERVFSVKRNCEIPTKDRTYVERYACIITEERAEEMAQAHLVHQKREAAFRNVKAMAETKNIEALRTAMAELEALLVAG